MESLSTEKSVDARQLLVVERSASMRQVLAQHLAGSGHTLTLVESYSAAAARLERRFDSQASWIDAVVFGWPTVSEAGDEDCLRALEENQAHGDLPLVVLSTDLRAETRAWVARRDNTALLVWKDYQEASAAISRLLHAPVDATVATGRSADAISLLIIDDDPLSAANMAALLLGRGHAVQVASTAARAVELARTGSVDLVLIDFNWNAQRGDALCRQLVDDPSCAVQAVALWLDHPAGHQQARCLEAGAVGCLHRSESLALQVAAIEALGRLASRRARQRAEPAAPTASTVLDQLRPFGWEADALPVLEELERRQLAIAPGSEHTLLMLLESRIDDADDPLPETERTAAGTALAAQAEQVLRQRVSAPARLARVEQHRFVILLDDRDGKPDYRQVRELMQACNAITVDELDGRAVSSVACVMAPARQPVLMLDRLLIRLRRGQALVAARETDRALLLDLKRLLPVYPPAA